MYINTKIHISSRTPLYIHVHKYICVHIYTYLCICKYIHTHIFTCSAVVFGKSDFWSLTSYLWKKYDLFVHLVYLYVYKDEYTYTQICAYELLHIYIYSCSVAYSEDSTPQVDYNTKHHSAIHCNTLQHTATHCNTMQRSATHCKHYNVLYRIATHCDTLQYTATLCITCRTANSASRLCITLQHPATHCNMMNLHFGATCTLLQCFAICGLKWVEGDWSGLKWVAEGWTELQTPSSTHSNSLKVELAAIKETTHCNTL